MRVIAQTKAHAFAESPTQTVSQTHPQSFVGEINNNRTTALDGTNA